MTRSQRLMLGLLVCAPLAGAGHAFASPTGEQDVERRSAPVACSGLAPVKTDPAAASIAPSLLTPTKTKKRSAACFVTVGSVMKQVTNARALLIDVRDAPAFEQFRIPGSLNVPLHAVKAKPFLKFNVLVLVNEGRSPSELQAACIELKKSGFRSVAVLSGGLMAWRDHGGALEGDSLQQNQLNLISPAQLFKEAAYDDWLILSIAGIRKNDLRNLLPYAEPVGASYQQAGLASQIKVVAMKRKLPSSRLNVVIVDATGSQHEKINAIAKRQNLKSVFYLDRGLQGYREFLRPQACRG